jgi:hypothetical protein
MALLSCYADRIDRPSLDLSQGTCAIYEGLNLFKGSRLKCFSLAHAPSSHKFDGVLLVISNTRNFRRMALGF